MLIRGAADEDDDVSAVEEVRKVEPLKINFYREPIRTVIKLGAGQSPEVQHHSPKFKIKPIPSHLPVVSSTNESGGGDEMRTVDEESVTGGGGGIPKLHFRINHGKVQVQELPLSQEQKESLPPVQGIPKLTIRNAMTTNCSALIGAESAIGENAMAPKLTIKMDHHSVPRLTIKTNSLGGHAIGEGVAPSEQQQHLTVPKLTIKVSNDQTMASGPGVRDLSPGSAIISSSTNSGGGGVSGEGLKLTLKKNVTQEVHNERSEEIHNHHHHPAALKLKMKLPRPPVVPSEEDDEEEDEDSEPSNSDGDETRATKTVPRIPKLTIKPVQGPCPPKKIYGTNQLHQDNDGGHQEAVTKLVIRPIPKPEEIAVNSSTAGGGMLISNHHYHHSRHVVASSSSGTPVATEILSLEVSSSAVGSVGPQSPRIILKINRNQNSIVSNTTELPVMADQLVSSAGLEENLLKRHLQQELVNSSGSGSIPKRTRGEERIIAMIDLDDEDSKPEVEKNGTQQRLAERDDEEERIVLDCENTKSVPTVPQSKKQLRSKETTEEEAIANKNSTQRIVPDDHRVLREEDPLAMGRSDSESRLMGSTSGDVLEEMQTPVVKRGRGRPRKTPLVAREDSDVVPETSKKRGRKKKDNDSNIQVPAIENVLVGM